MPLIKGLNLSAGPLFSIAKSNCESIQNVASPTTGGQDAALITIIFSAASIEAFFNEFLEILSMMSNRTNDPPPIPIYLSLAEEIESNKGSIKLKFILAYSILTGQPCDKGGHPYQDFSLLLEARNGIMHMRPMDFLGPMGPDGTAAFEAAKIIDKLRSKGIVDDLPPANQSPWHNRIATQAGAKWACNTAADVVTIIINALPDAGPYKIALRDAYSMFVRLA
jgi:hypothetical protein